jgi:hypothetical protein
MYASVDLEIFGANNFLNRNSKFSFQSITK